MSESERVLQKISKDKKERKIHDTGYVIGESESDVTPVIDNESNATL